MIFAIRVFATRCLLYEEDGNADRPSANNPGSDRRIDFSQWERYGGTYSTCEVYGYHKVYLGIVRYRGGMTPGMRVCSPLYPTAGILRGIFDFEPGHRETSDKWLFVFRGGESIIITPPFQAAVEDCPAMSFLFVCRQIESKMQIRSVR